MNELSINKLTMFIVTPFLILFGVWWIIGEDFNLFFIQFINSIFSTTLLTLGIATLCSWWFCLTRSSKINIPIILTIILILITITLEEIMSLESISPPGLHTPLAILLNNSLELLTIILSFGFTLIIGLLISRESDLEEE